MTEREGLRGGGSKGGTEGKKKWDERGVVREGKWERRIVAKSGRKSRAREGVGRGRRERN